MLHSTASSPTNINMEELLVKTQKYRNFTSQGLEDFGHGKPFPQPLPAEEQYVVEFMDENDPLHPQNWPFARK